MYKKTRLGGCVDGGGAAKPQQQPGYVETDPSARYGRFREILGKGATKTVYKAFDEVLGMEVAWNQVKLNDVFHSPDELQRLYSEVHLLKNFNHDCIIKFCTAWIDVERRTFNFVTEMFTSGTLREYRHKYQRVDIRVVKNWARQILSGLAYLHEHDPPVIHRDLKCDNIFVNGHLGQVKIGDLGLAAILHGSQHAHSVIGTPEFMAPELYEEEYDELVDIYSFGMCMLEMLTSEYPYSECSNPAQIYKKVTSGKLPEAFYQIKDAEAQKFVGKCLESASKRLPARELLLDPFLDDEVELPPISKVPFQRSIPSNGTVPDMLPSLLSDPTKSSDMTITGTMNPEDNTIFLKGQITDKEGRTRNIFFPFDTMNDTAIDVAMEMVKELEISDWEPFEIAEMIEEEIASLVPGWKDLDLSPQVHHRQHSFNYDEDDDEEVGRIHHPFHSTSSNSSFPASPLHAFNPSSENLLRCKTTNITSPANDWLQEELFIYDDASSQSSLNSSKYTNLNYCSGNEDDCETGLGAGEPSRSAAGNRKSTRVCPEGDVILSPKQCKQQNGQSAAWGCGVSNPQRKLSRIQSLVDLRNQLLHRSLVEQIHKRRLFKTIGAVENIGFHAPVLPGNDERQRFKW